MSTSVETGPDIEAPRLLNPFLQFVDPQRYRELVELVNKRAEPGRLICPLSRRAAGPTRMVITRIEIDVAETPQAP